MAGGPRDLNFYRELNEKERIRDAEKRLRDAEKAKIIKQSFLTFNYSEMREELLSILGKNNNKKILIITENENSSNDLAIDMIVKGKFKSDCIDFEYYIEYGYDFIVKKPKFENEAFVRVCKENKVNILISSKWMRENISECQIFDDVIFYDFFEEKKDSLYIERINQLIAYLVDKGFKGNAIAMRRIIAN